MRCVHFLRHTLRPHDVERSPVLAHLGAVNAALDALLLALTARQPRALRVVADEPYDLKLRQARSVAALALALQAAMAHLQDIELERIAIDERPP